MHLLKSFISPFLFAIYPVLFLLSYNIDQVIIADVFWPLIVVTGFSTLSFAINLMLLKNYYKASVITSLFLILFFSLGHVFKLIQGIEIGSVVIGRVRYLQLLWLSFFLYVFYKIYKSKKDLSKLVSFFTVAGSILITITSLPVASYFITKQRNPLIQINSATIPISQDKIHRDIYYIILDEYAGYNTLKTIFNYNNSEIYSFLKGKGFYINTESNSNYPITWLSLASSLNMNYIHAISGEKPLNEWKTIYSLVQDNRVANFLKAQGYDFINVSSGTGPTNHNSHATQNLCDNGYNEFLLLLIQTSAMLPLQNYYVRYKVREKILDSFSEIPKISAQSGNPKFVFAHIVCPHYPYVFGKNGEYVETPLLSGQFEWEGTETYLNQLTYVNGKIKETVDGILQNSKTAPIIIIQSDHGSSYTLGGSCDASYKWDVADSIMINERMGIINAYYLPKGDSSIYQGITPVNTFRKIFNFYFNASFPILEDKSYWSTYKNPFSFKECTDILKPESKRINQHPTETP